MNYSASDVIADTIQSVGMDFENGGMNGNIVIRAFIYLVDTKINHDFAFNSAHYIDLFPAYAREKADELFRLHFPKVRKELPF